MGGEDKYYFDAEAGERVVRFIETHLYHFEDVHAGKPFKLLPWQRKIITDLFGTKRKDNHTRRYKEMYLEIAKGAGKSPLLTAIGMAMLLIDHEPGAHVVSVAADFAQANITFDHAKKFIQSSPVLRRKEKKGEIVVKQFSITVPKTNSKWTIMSGTGEGKHGIRPTCVIADEAHEWSTRALYDNLSANMHKRTEPLMLVATNAGASGESICWELHERAQRVIDGTSADETLYPVIYTTDRDIDDPKGWYEANPSLGYTVTEEGYRAEAVKAKETKPLEARFRRFWLSQWVEASTRWLNLDTFDACTSDDIHYDHVRGERCYIAVDLSQTYDLTAIVLLYPNPQAHPGKWVVIPHVYCPQDTAASRTRDDDVPYTTWIQEGHVVGTPGRTIHYPTVEREISRFVKENEVIEFVFDRTYAALIAGKLEDEGVVVVEAAKGFGLSVACKEFERRLNTQEIVIKANPAMRQAAASVEVKMGQHGDIYPVKPNAKGKYAGTAKYKIDPLEAAIYAVSRAMLRPSDEGVPEWDGTISFV